MEGIYDAVSALMDCDTSQVTEGTLSDLALRLDALNRTLVIAKDLADAVKLQLAETMEDDDMVVPGVGMVHRRQKSSVRVAVKPPKVKADLAIAVSATIGRDPYTGEIDKTRRDVSRETVDLVTKCISVGATSFTAAAQDLIGLAAEDYTEKVWTTQIIIETQDDEA
jgi:hypothetical protein